MRTRAISALLSSVMAMGAFGVVFASPASGGMDVAARTFSNCTALNKVYPHGVGKWGAKDKTSGERVTNFKRSNRLYNANRGSDRDGDGIACEKH